MEISFLVADMRYSEAEGTQICEIQHGVPSTFKGEAFSNNGVSFIANNLVDCLNRYYSHSWVQINAFQDKNLVQRFRHDPTWLTFESLKDLDTEAYFCMQASNPVYNPKDLSFYHGFLFMEPIKSDEWESIAKSHPGIVIIDKAIHQYRRDKVTMSEFFVDHPVLQNHKPKWKAFEKKYTDNLAKMIFEAIPSNRFVIKPVAKFKGKGVIIADRAEMDAKLKYIFKETNKKPPGYDPTFDDWFRDNSDQFIVEAFAEADPIQATHLKGKFYSPTLRVAYLLIYNKETVEIVCLGGYCSLPRKALSEKGSLNDKYKSCCKIPYYCKADPVVMQKAINETLVVMKIIYQRMLERL